MHVVALKYFTFTVRRSDCGAYLEEHFMRYNMETLMRTENQWLGKLEGGRF